MPGVGPTSGHQAPPAVTEPGAAASRLAGFTSGCQPASAGPFRDSHYQGSAQQPAAGVRGASSHSFALAAIIGPTPNFLSYAPTYFVNRPARRPRQCAGGRLQQQPRSYHPRGHFAPGDGGPAHGRRFGRRVSGRARRVGAAGAFRGQARSQSRAAQWWAGSKPHQHPLILSRLPGVHPCPRLWFSRSAVWAWLRGAAAAPQAEQDRLDRKEASIGEK